MAAAVMGAISGQGGDNASCGMLLSREQMQLMEEAFLAADDDGSGALSQGEMYALWGYVFPDMDKKELRKVADTLWQDLDPNGDGHVSWHEIEMYFGGNAEEMSDVDKMIHINLVHRAPTAVEAAWYMLDPDAPQYIILSKWLNVGKVACAFVSNGAICVSIGNLVQESMPAAELKKTQLQGAAQDHWGFVIEAICIAIFTSEFLARAIVAPVKKALWLNFFTWVDIFAIAPFYIGIAFAANQSDSLVVLRVLRLLRLLRMLKLGKQFEAVQVLIIAIARTVGPLLVSMIGINSIAILLFSALLVSAERYDAHFDSEQVLWVRNNDSEYRDAGLAIQFQSIPESMWWTWVTLTTVGYGDIVPRTGPGKAVAAITMLLGLILMAFPLTLLASSFADTMSELRAKKESKKRADAFSEKIKKSQAGRAARLTLGGAASTTADDARESLQQLQQHPALDHSPPKDDPNSNHGACRRPGSDDAVGASATPVMQAAYRNENHSGGNTNRSEASSQPFAMSPNANLRAGADCARALHSPEADAGNSAAAGSRQPTNPLGPRRNPKPPKTIGELAAELERHEQRIAAHEQSVQRQLGEQRLMMCELLKQVSALPAAILAGSASAHPVPPRSGWDAADAAGAVVDASRETSPSQAAGRAGEPRLPGQSSPAGSP